MRPISERYEYIYTTYYHQKARTRYNHLVKYADFFLRSLDLGEDVFISVDLEKCDSFITSYFLDVMRYKEYHFSPNSEPKANPEYIFSEKWVESVHTEKLLSPGKVASFTAKWLIKYSPIVILPKVDAVIDESDRETIRAAPAVLALNFSLLSLDIDPTKIRKKTYRDLLYHFRFRNFDERAFFLVFDEFYEEFNLHDTALEAVEGVADPPRADREVVAPVKATETRRANNKSYSVFIASPGDCDFLRKAASEVISEINETISARYKKLVPFMWETGKIAEHTDGEFQDRIFKDAERLWEKPECDIFIISLWYRYSENTIKEYDYYIEKSKGCSRLLSCRFGGDPPIDQIAKARTDELEKWLESKHDDWAEISPTRLSIRRVAKYKKALKKQLELYLNEAG